MTVGEVCEYLHGFTYILGEKEEEALALFREYLDAYDRDTADRPPIEEAPHAG